jgi:membrane fusion protein (multidrug efflux system)
MPVQAARIVREAVAAKVEAVGGLDAVESVVLRPEIAGRIAALHFNEGQKVKAGTLLVELDAAEQRANLAQSEAQQTMDSLSFERIQAIRAKNLVSQQQYDEAWAKLKNTEALRERDRVRLSKMRLNAPFEGVLGLRQVSVGDYVAPGQALVNLEALDPVRLDFQIPEKYAALAHPGQKVEMQTDAWPGRVFTGQVHAVDPRLNDATRAVKVRAYLPNPDLALKPGMSCGARLLLGGERPVLFAPEEALVAKGSQALLYRVENGKAVMTPVATGMRKPGWVEISEGAHEGDLIVTQGQLKLRDGAPVQVLTPDQP